MNAAYEASVNAACLASALHIAPDADTPIFFFTNPPPYTIVTALSLQMQSVEPIVIAARACFNPPRSN
jgi:hypothetical protein